MTKLIKCISPIDGSVYAERPALSMEAAEAAVANAKAAQRNGRVARFPNALNWCRLVLRNSVK